MGRADCDRRFLAGIFRPTTGIWQKKAVIRRKTAVFWQKTAGMRAFRDGYWTVEAVKQIDLQRIR
jgi:hypothetical protein